MPATSTAHPPVCVIVGADPTLVSREHSTRLEAALEGLDRSLALVELNPEAEIEGLELQLRSPSIFSDAQVCSLRLAKACSEELTELLLSFARSPEPGVTLVVSMQVKPAPSLTKALREVGIQPLDLSVPQQAGARRSFAEEMLRAGPVNLDGPARAEICRHLGEDVSRIPALLDLLAAAYGGAEIGVGDLDGFLGEAGSVPPWDLTDAIDRGDARLALVQLHRLLGARAPLQVLAILSSHLERMFRVGAAGVRDEVAAAALLGMKGSTFPAKKAIAGARSWGTPSLEAGAALVASAGVDLKGGSSWPDHLVLEVLVSRLAALRARR